MQGEKATGTMFHDVCTTEILPIMRGGRKAMPDDVWLSRNITKGQSSDEGGTYDTWEADRVHVMTDMTDAEIEADFDRLWDGAELAKRGTRELALDGRAAALSAQEAADDATLALADLGGTVSDNASGTADLMEAVAELGVQVAALMGAKD